MGPALDRPRRCEMLYVKIVLAWIVIDALLVCFLWWRKESRRGDR